MQTQINQASIKAPVVVNEAEAKRNSTLVTNKAHMESFVKITTIEAKAYGLMKEKLKMTTDEDFLKYMRVKTINQFNQKNLLIGIAPTVEIKDPSQANQQNQANPKPAKATPPKPAGNKAKGGDKKNGKMIETNPDAKPDENQDNKADHDDGF